MPILTFESKDKVPADFSEIAKEVDGKWTINVVAKAKLDEFRENNVALAEERDGLKTTIGAYKKVVGEDLEEFTNGLAELKTTAQNVTDGKLKSTKDIDAAVEARLVERVGAMKTEHEAQMSELLGKNKDLTSAVMAGEAKYNKTVVSKFITDAVIDGESGVTPQALPDILTRANEIFKVNEDGDVVAMKSDGKTIIYGSDGTTPMTGKEWVQGLEKTAPHFFASNTGGNANGGDTKGKFPNGMSQEEFNKLPAAQRLDFSNKQKQAA